MKYRIWEYKGRFYPQRRTWPLGLYQLMMNGGWDIISFNTIEEARTYLDGVKARTTRVHEYEKYHKYP